MKIEVGKSYKTRDGRIVGPMLTRGTDFHQIGCSQIWRQGGTVWGECGDESGDYIASELVGDTTPPIQDLSLAEQVKQHGILIAVTNGDITITYDGREQ